MRRVPWAVILTALALFDLPAHASPEPVIGPSYLGMCSEAWPCGRSLRVFEGREVKATGWLSVTFGEECPCAKRFLALPGRKVVRVHLANCTCFKERGRECGSNEPFRGETIKSAERKLLRRDRSLLRRYRRNLLLTKRVLGGADAETEVLLSLCLESELTGPARRVLLREARKVFPSGTFVDSVVGRACLPELVCEKHGEHATFPPGQACIADTDGDDYRAIDFPAYLERNRRCKKLLWEPGFNLLPDVLGPFEYPLERTHRPSFGSIRYALP
jgi:hypothetical protein